MGSGAAAAIRRTIRGIDRELGEKIRKNGHIVQLIHERVISFPVKPETTNNVLPRCRARFGNGPAPGWAGYAEPKLIERSFEQLDYLAQDYVWPIIFLPIPGAGNGGLSRGEALSLVPDRQWLILVDKPRGRA